SLTVYEPNPASFYVGVDSQLPVSFQWRKDGANLFGQTYYGLTLYNTSPADNGNYDVVVSNSSGSITSSVAALTVLLRPPQIEAQASDQPLAVGLPLSLYAFVSGSPPLSYRWLKNGAPISGATSNTYQIAATQFSDAGDYQIVVSNAVGAVTGAVIRVSIVP